VVAKHEDREWVLLQRRNMQKAFHGKHEYQCSAAGMVNAHRNLRPSGIDVFAAAKNELQEELGVPYREEQIAFLGLARETMNLEVGLLAEVYVEDDPAKLWKLSADSFEVLGVLACPFTPEDYASFIAERGGLDNFAPLGAAAVVYALLKHFPSERVEAAFARLAKS
jgi:hypothetical protein